MQVRGKAFSFIYPEEVLDAEGYAAKSFASYYLLFNGWVPLSIVITVELAKMFYTRFIENDIQMI